MPADTDSLDVKQIAKDLDLAKSDAASIRQSCLNAGYSVFQAGYITGWLRAEYPFDPNEMAPRGISTENLPPRPVSEEPEKEAPFGSSFKEKPVVAKKSDEKKESSDSKSLIERTREKLTPAQENKGNQSGSQSPTDVSKHEDRLHTEAANEKPMTFQQRADALAEKKSS